MAKDLEGFVARLTALGGGSGDSRALYETWAPFYERNMEEDYGYIAPRLAVEAFSAHAPDRAASIIDLACGTGLVGAELASRGYQQVDGLDVSPAMLDQARVKQLYRALHVGDLTQPPPPAARGHDAAICVGCFGGGHLGPQHLAGLTEYVVPGGLLVLYINGLPYAEDDYPAHFAALEKDRIWQVLLTAQSNYMQALDRPGWVVVARRCDTVAVDSQGT